MTSMVIGLLFAGLLAGSQTQVSSECVPSNPSGALLQLCLGEQETIQGEMSSEGDAERRRRFETAAEHYRHASNVGTAELRLKALTLLARTYDVQHLNDQTRRETVLRELADNLRRPGGIERLFYVIPPDRAVSAR